MAHVLKNKDLEIHIDEPGENYVQSRFDWTGKIVEVKFQDIRLTANERNDGENEDDLGKGFYNEFGIDSALGFEETAPGGWFHKIGVGLLLKDTDQYLFNHPYKIKPAQFNILSNSNSLIIICKSHTINGYAYVLRKEIEILEHGFTISYHLENTGEKDIKTSEYVHNFIAVNDDLIGNNYLLKFPFPIKPDLFEETVNPEQSLVIGQKQITFHRTPKEPFFFSFLSGKEVVDAAWELIHRKSRIGLGESGSFKTKKVNLWGWSHVISPELFIDISIKPGQSAEWSRTYHIYRVL